MILLSSYFHQAKKRKQIKSIQARFGEAAQIMRKQYFQGHVFL